MTHGAAGAKLTQRVAQTVTGYVYMHIVIWLQFLAGFKLSEYQNIGYHSNLGLYHFAWWYGSFFS